MSSLYVSVARILARAITRWHNFSLRTISLRMFLKWRTIAHPNGLLVRGDIGPTLSYGKCSAFPLTRFIPRQIITLCFCVCKSHENGEKWLDLRLRSVFCIICREVREFCIVTRSPLKKKRTLKKKDALIPGESLMKMRDNGESKLYQIKEKKGAFIYEKWSLQIVDR